MPGWFSRLLGRARIEALEEKVLIAKKREQYYDLQGANFRSVKIAHQEVEELERSLAEARERNTR